MQEYRIEICPIIGLGEEIDSVSISYDIGM